MKPIACLLLPAAIVLGGLHLALAQGAASPVLVEVVGAEMSSLCREADIARARRLAEACEGKQQCRFTPEAADAAGEACARDSVVLWRCGAGETRQVPLAPAPGRSREITMACEQPVLAAAPPPAAPAPPPTTIVASIVPPNEAPETVTVTTPRPVEPRVEAPVRAAEPQFQSEMAVIQRHLETPTLLPSLEPGTDKYLRELRVARGGAPRMTTSSILPGDRGQSASAPRMLTTARIGLVQATWGGNCRQNEGNETTRLTNACNGKAQCVFTVAERGEGEAPEACARDYQIVWTCGGDPRMHAATLPPAKGQSREVRLACPE